MFEKALIGKNNIWKYILVLFLVFVCTQVISGVLLFSTLGNEGIVALSNGNYEFLYAQGFSKNLIYALFLSPFVGGFFAFLGLIKWIQKKSFTSISTGASKFRWKRFMFGFDIWAVLWLCVFGLGLLAAPEDYTFQFDLQKFAILALISILFLPLQTGLEELLFRGYLLQGFQLLTKSKIASVLITSVLFALLHLANPEVEAFGFWLSMGTYLSLGLLFGLLTLKDDGLELAWGIHCANNLLVALLVSHKDAAFQTDALTLATNVEPVEGLISIVIMAIITYFACHKLLGWNKKKEAKETLAEV
ncbi:CPBP family intramembrane glutamic endopeptidase [Sediminitomix flava]|uniref:CAAX prenyl protease 2/Lysostaphin resistance protein A-like domain-containing protein n=1 Tax=Sediminitomix flava TaxID=379075 RepID=A0A315ZDD8_SEDFL|nr:CPBP family intramembrane glutamic endopeptidase [Sediminitomix flava]PWJ43332.1 hypothetical protein BC781_102889 [Sediminitomix flava]